ncbi:hypothetical protein EV175_003158 [Coemansia sp. RSA 1933]|nr:hypothetical protein EV175_003158 [Coemansia sp. RSA 1933]
MSNSERGEPEQIPQSSGRGGRPDTTGLYTLLCVDCNATQSDLKRAYRRLALVHHPDRNRAARESTSDGTTDSGAAFVRIQYAYDVLSDARKRRIYDRYGEMGVQMAGRVGGALLDPQVTRMLSSFAIGSAVVALLMVAFFTLLARRVDHIWNIPFALVFTPLWLVDAIVVAGIVWFYVKGRAVFGGGQSDNERSDGDDDDPDSVAGSDDPEESNNMPNETQPPATGYGSTETTATATTADQPGRSDSEEHAQSSANPDASPLATSKTPLLATIPTDSNIGTSGDSSGSASSSTRKRYNDRMKRRRLRKVRSHAEVLFRCIAAPAPIVYLSLLFAFQILVVLRLDHHVKWSVWHIVSPWLGIEAVHFVLLTLRLVESMCLAAEQATRAQAPANGQRRPSALALKHVVVLAADAYWWLAIRVSLALLIASKLDPLGMAHTWSWALVFAPSYLPFVRWSLMLCFLRQNLRSMGEAEIAQNEKAIFGAYVAVVAITCAFLYSTVALLIWKLSLPQAVRMVLVLVPAFVALSLCCCFCSCISLCLSYGITATLDEEQRMESGDAANDSTCADTNGSDSRASSPSGSTGRVVVPANRRIE